MDYYNQPGTSYYSGYGGQPGMMRPQGQTMQTQYMQPNMSMQPAMPLPQTQPALNGKIVDSEEMVKATEVPYGSYGIFPKADFSAVYIKTWNPNGTTNIICYRPIAPQEPKQLMLEDKNGSEEIIQRIDMLENKIETYFEKGSMLPPQEAMKKEATSHAY